MYFYLSYNLTKCDKWKSNEQKKNIWKGKLWTLCETEIILFRFLYVKNFSLYFIINGYFFFYFDEVKSSVWLILFIMILVTRKFIKNKNFLVHTLISRVCDSCDGDTVNPMWNTLLNFYLYITLLYKDNGSPQKCNET